MACLTEGLRACDFLGFYRIETAHFLIWYTAVLFASITGFVQ